MLLMKKFYCALLHRKIEIIGNIFMSVLHKLPQLKIHLDILKYSCTSVNYRLYRPNWDGREHFLKTQSLTCFS